MTRRFNVHYTCARCGHQTTAESGFGRWMRDQPALDSVHGIVRTDLDHVIVRYKTSLDQRDFQLLMVVEVKEFGAEPDPSQVDILSFFRQIGERAGYNMHGAKTTGTYRLYSRISGRFVNVRFFGVHLLQFEKTNPNDSEWIRWDHKDITEGVLVGLLAMERRPDNPDQMMIETLRDRHRKPVLLPGLL